jgi:putative cardiolipin synthase
LLLPPPSRDDEEALAQRLHAQREGPAALRYQQALAGSTFAADFLARRLEFEWARVQLVSDDPAKALGEIGDGELFWQRLVRIVARPRVEFTLSSPYFVPGASGVEQFAAMAAAGVRITVLTNSLEATDQPAVHSGYAKRRVALLRAGVALYELKRGDDAGAGATQPTRGSASSGGSQSPGSSASSLHAKAFTVDGAHVFVGSFNYDPRSANLNTEMGFVIDSPTLAQSMQSVLRRRLAENAYRVRLSESGTLQWIEVVDGRERVHDVEPGTTFWSRLGVSLLSLLPIDWLL